MSTARPAPAPSLGATKSANSAKLRLANMSPSSANAAEASGNRPPRHTRSRIDPPPPLTAPCYPVHPSQHLLASLVRSYTITPTLAPNPVWSCHCSRDARLVSLPLVEYATRASLTALFNVRTTSRSICDSMIGVANLVLSCCCWEDRQLFCTRESID